MAPVVGVLHPGRLGSFLGSRIRAGGASVVWCAHGRSGDTARRAREAGLVAVRLMADLVEQSTVIMSVCPPQAAEQVAGLVARHGFHGLYVEANSISPARFERIRQTLGASGATVVDAAVIGPPPGPGVGEHLYLAGPEVPVKRVAGLFPGDGVEVTVLGDRPGAASALKMAHTVYMRGARALAATALSLGGDYGVDEALLAEAGRRPRSALTEPEHLPRVAARAARGASELLEAADTLRDAGLPADLAVAAHDVFEQWAAHACRPGGSLAEVLDCLRPQTGEVSG